MAGRGYRNLNNSVIRQIAKVLEDDDEADLEAVLIKMSTTYAKFRRPGVSGGAPDEETSKRCVVK